MKKGVLILMLALVGLLGFLIINEATNETIYSISLNSAYAVVIFVLMALGILAALDIITIHGIKKKFSDWLYFIIFLPLVLYSVFRCYFKIPWIFCHICPRKCVWGSLRPYVVPGAVLMNFQQRFWCFNYCPVGKLQDEQAKCCKKKIVLPKWASWVRYLVLVAIIIVYFVSLVEAKSKGLSAMFMFKNVFSTSIVVLAVGLVVLLISFFIHRFFCNYICPIGCVGDLVLKAERKIK
jgi:hypothetical protein